MNKSNSPENRSFTSFAANRWPENGAGMMSVNSQYVSLSRFRHKGLHLKTRTTKAHQNTTAVKEAVQAKAKLSEAKQSYTWNSEHLCHASGFGDGIHVCMHKEWDGGRIQNKVTPFLRQLHVQRKHGKLLENTDSQRCPLCPTTAQSKAPMHQSWILMTGSIVLTADVAVEKNCMFWSCFVIGFRACARQESASKNGLVMRGNMRGVGRSCCGKNDQKCVACYMFISLTGNPWALDQWISREKQAFLWLQGFLKCRPTCWGPSDYEALPMSDAIFIHTWMFLRLQRFWFQCQFNFGLASTLNHSPVWRSFTWQSIACFFVLWRVVPAVQKNSHDVMMCWEIGAFFAFVEHRLWDHQPRRTSWTPTGF